MDQRTIFTGSVFGRFGSFKAHARLAGGLMAFLVLLIAAIGENATPLFVVPVGVPAGGPVSEIDLAPRVPVGGGLVGPFKFAFSGAKPEWVTLSGSVLRVAPPVGAAVTTVPIAVGLTVTDSAATPAARMARVDVGVFPPPPSPAGPVLVSGLEGGVTVRMLEGNPRRVAVEAAGVVGSSGWTGPALRFVPAASNPENAVLEFVAMPPPPNVIVLTVVSVVKAVAVLDAPATLKRVVVRTKGGEAAAPVLDPVVEKPFFVAAFSAPAGGPVLEADLSKMVPTDSALSAPYRFSIEGSAPEWVSVSGSVVRIAPPPFAVPTVVPIPVSVKLLDASEPSASRLGRLDLIVLPPVVAPPGPVREPLMVMALEGEIGVVVSGSMPRKVEVRVQGTVSSVGWTDAKLRPAVGLSSAEEAVFELVATPPAEMSAPVVSGVKTTATFEVPASLKRIVVLTKAGRSSVVLPPGEPVVPLGDKPLFAIPLIALSGGEPVTLDLLKELPGDIGLVAPLSFATEGQIPGWVSLSGSVLRVAPPSGIVPPPPIVVGIKVADSSAAGVAKVGRIEVKVLPEVVVPLPSPVPVLVTALNGGVALRVVDGAPRKVIVEVVGNVPTGGWSAPMLRPVTQTVSAEVAVFEFVATAPEGIAIQAFSAVKASVTVDAPPSLKRIAVLTKAGRVEAVISEVGVVTNVGALAGEYVGILRPTSQTQSGSMDSLASVSVTVGKTGALTGRITRRRADGNQSFVGASDGSGRIVFGKASALGLMSGRTSLGSLSLQLSAGSEGRKMTGKVVVLQEGSPVEVASLDGAAVRLPTPMESGRYTGVFRSGNGSLADRPRGHGTTSFTVGSGGLSMTGTLADGSPFATVSRIREDGSSPVFVPLYSGRGLLSGVVNLDAKDAETDAAGVALIWHREKGVSTPSVYAQGWPEGMTTDLRASKFDPAKAFGVKPIAPMKMSFNVGEGMASRAVSEELVLSTRNVLSSSPNSPIRLTSGFATASGAVQGSFLPQGSKVRVNYSAMVLQKSGYAAGFSLRDGKSDPVEIRSSAP